MARPVKPPEDSRSYSAQNTTVKKKTDKAKAQLSSHIAWQIDHFWMEFVFYCGNVWLRPELLTLMLNSTFHSNCFSNPIAVVLRPAKNSVFSPFSSVRLTGSWLAYSCGPWAPEHLPHWQQTRTSIRTFNTCYRDLKHFFFRNTNQNKIHEAGLTVG